MICQNKFFPSARWPPHSKLYARTIYSPTTPLNLTALLNSQKLKLYTAVNLPYVMGSSRNRRAPRKDYVKLAGRIVE